MLYVFNSFIKDLIQKRKLWAEHGKNWVQWIWVTALKPFHGAVRCSFELFFLLIFDLQHKTPQKNKKTPTNKQTNMEWIPKKERQITDHTFLERCVKIRGGSKYIYFYDSTSSLRILYPLIRTSKTFHVFSFWFCMNVSVTNSPRAERYKPVLQLSGIVCHFSRTSVFISQFERISLLVLRCRFGSFTVEEGTWSSPLPSRRWAFMFFLFCFFTQGWNI